MADWPNCLGPAVKRPDRFVDPTKVSMDTVKLWPLLFRLRQMAFEVASLKKSLEKPAKCEERRMREALKQLVAERKELRAVIIETIEE